MNYGILNEIVWGYVKKMREGKFELAYTYMSVLIWNRRQTERERERERECVCVCVYVCEAICVSVSLNDELMIMT